MVTTERDGSLTFRVYLPHAQSVHLVADFNEWRKDHLPLASHEHHGDPGWWFVRHHVAEGDHEFSYLVDSSWYLPDYAAHGVRRNEFGNWTSLLCVQVAKPAAVTITTSTAPSLKLASYIEATPAAAALERDRRTIRMADAIRAMSDFDALAEHPIAG